MAPLITRRAALTALGALAAGSLVGVGFAMRNVLASASPDLRLSNGPGRNGPMGVDPADMRAYMDMFMRHNDINRVVEDIPGGVRTTTESNFADLAAQLQAHVSSMYARVAQGAEVRCMSQSLPTLFRNPTGYRRQLTFTPTGVIAEETADDAGLVRAIREHAQEVSGFVRDGMPAMMGEMMGGGMMGGGMMRPR